MLLRAMMSWILNIPKDRDSITLTCSSVWPPPQEKKKKWLGKLETWNIILSFFKSWTIPALSDSPHTKADSTPQSSSRSLVGVANILDSEYSVILKIERFTVSTFLSHFYIKWFEPCTAELVHFCVSCRHSAYFRIWPGCNFFSWKANKIILCESSLFPMYSWTIQHSCTQLAPKKCILPRFVMKELFLSRSLDLIGLLHQILYTCTSKWRKNIAGSSLPPKGQDFAYFTYC